MWYFRGIYFDMGKAELLHAELQMELDKSIAEVGNVMVVVPGKLFVPKVNRNGYNKGCACTKIKIQKLNPTSRQQLSKHLTRKHGWIPRKYHKGGTPVLDATVLAQLPKSAEVFKTIILLTDRLGDLVNGAPGKAWMRAVWRDGRIHTNYAVSGCVTGRMIYTKPVISGVPQCDKPYGKKCRELYCAPKGAVLVGGDAAAIEMRMLAHFLWQFDSGEFATSVLHGDKTQGTDVHSRNMVALGYGTRATAKTFFYAYIYGAGLEKLGLTLDPTLNSAQATALGRKTKKQFEASMPALKRLKSMIENILKNRDYFVGLDGRRLPVRSAHSALNLLCQAGATVVMKKSLVLLDGWLKEAGICVGTNGLVGNVVDEHIIQCYHSNWELCGKLLRKSIVDAGEYFELKVPMDADYHVGNSWADIH